MIKKIKGQLSINVTTPNIAILPQPKVIIPLFGTAFCYNLYELIDKTDQITGVNIYPSTVTPDESIDPFSIDYDGGGQVIISGNQHNYVSLLHLLRQESFRVYRIKIFNELNTEVIFPFINDVLEFYRIAPNGKVLQNSIQLSQNKSTKEFNTRVVDIDIPKGIWINDITSIVHRMETAKLTGNPLLKYTFFYDEINFKK